MKLWKVTVNNWGWDKSKTYYAASREEAEKILEEYPAGDPVEYAGNYSEDMAEQLLQYTSERGAW